MKRTDSRTGQNVQPDALRARACEQARQLCDFGYGACGQDSHACVRVSASLPRYHAPAVNHAVFDAYIEGSGNDRQPYGVVLQIDARFAGGVYGGHDEQDAELHLPDVRHLPILIDTLTLLLDRARSIGMIPPDEPET